MLQAVYSNFDQNNSWETLTTSLNNDIVRFQPDLPYIYLCRKLLVVIRMTSLYQIMINVLPGMLTLEQLLEMELGGKN